MRESAKHETESYTCKRKLSMKKLSIKKLSMRETAKHERES